MTVTQSYQLAIAVDRFMRRLHAAMHHRAVTFDVDRIGPLGGMTLMTLADIEPAPIQQLCAAMARDKAQMTRLIQMLEGKGLIERRGSSEDRRVTLLRLTVKGQGFVHLVRNAMTNIMDDILSPLTASELSKFSMMLEKLEEIDQKRLPDSDQLERADLKRIRLNDPK